MAQYLQNTAESTTELPKQEEDKAAFKDWSNKKFMALHVIQNSCGPDTVSEIQSIGSGKISWNTSAEKCNMPKNIDTGLSLSLHDAYICMNIFNGLIKEINIC